MKADEVIRSTCHQVCAVRACCIVGCVLVVPEGETLDLVLLRDPLTTKPHYEPLLVLLLLDRNDPTAGWLYPRTHSS